MCDASGRVPACGCGGASRSSLHQIHPVTTFFSPFRSDGNAVAAEWGKDGFLGRRLCSNERKYPPGEPVASRRGRTIIPGVPLFPPSAGLLFAWQRYFRKQQSSPSLQDRRGRIVKTWTVGTVVLVVCLSAAMAMAANPVAADSNPSLTPAGTALCTYACYCPKSMPCLTPPACDGICVPYCCKSMPCLTPPACDGICVPYCRKPMPCLCNPIARPECCESPSCVGAGRYPR